MSNTSSLALHDKLKHHVSVHLDKIAMVCEETTATFGQLYETAGRIAGALSDQGIKPGDRVGIFLRNHPSYIPMLYFFELGMEYGIRYDEVNLCTTPLYHNAAIFFALNNLYFGSTTVVHRKFDRCSVKATDMSSRWFPRFWFWEGVRATPSIAMSSSWE